MNTNQIARVAALIGEPARTSMLLALMDGRALTALELARAARVSAPTASRHLALLVESGLLRVERQGRHRYHRLASREVAAVLEGLMRLAASDAVPPPRVIVSGPHDAALRTARTCYDHVAGRLGVAIADRLQAEGAVRFEGDAGYATDRAGPCLARLGLDGAEDGASASGSRRPACRPCLDWSERRPHLAGRLGARICRHFLEQGWLRQAAAPRVLTVTPPGAAMLRDWLGMDGWARFAAGDSA